LGSIDFNSVLTAWYNSKAGISASSSASGSAASSKPSNPTPPWSSSSSAAQLSALAQSVLNGGNVIDPTAAKLDVTGAGVATNQNYRNLFALYQGLSALNGLAQSASAPNVGSTNLQQIQTAFQAGVHHINLLWRRSSRGTETRGKDAAYLCPRRRESRKTTTPIGAGYLR